VIRYNSLEKMRKRTISIFLILLTASFTASASADTLSLKNGGVIEGIIEKEDQDKIELNMGFGTATFQKRQIKKIERATAEENGSTIKKWDQKRRDLEVRAKEFEEAREKRFDTAYKDWMEEANQKKLKASGEAKHIQIARDERTRSIIVETLLNEKVKASLVLDTGASLVVLSMKIGEELGVDTTDTKNDIIEFRLADGSRTRAKTLVLDSVRIQDVEVNKVMAAVMLEQVHDPSLRDGLLGMSFLNRFNLKMDLKSMNITLEKLNEADNKN